MQSKAFGKNYFFGKKSPYGKYFPEERQREKFFGFLAENGIQVKKKKVLEVGCAFGFYLKKLEKEGAQAFGLDKSSFAAGKAKELGLKNVFLGDIQKPAPFEPAHFDFIYSLDTIEHLENPKAMAENCFSLLKENGTLLLVTPNRKAVPLMKLFYRLTGKKLKDETHISLLSQKQVKALFSEWKTARVFTAFWGMRLTENKSFLKSFSRIAEPFARFFGLGSYIVVFAEKGKANP